MKQTADFPISYHKKENGGKHTALNYAYQFIQTPLTFIVDSDDSLTEDAISCIIEIWKKYKNESDLCGFSFLRGKPDGGCKFHFHHSDTETSFTTHFFGKIQYIGIK